MKHPGVAAIAASIVMAMAGSAARAATLVDFAGPTDHLPSPDFVLFTFDAGAGAGSASFTIDGFHTLDGIVSNNLEDDFTLTVNGVDILKGTWDLGGGGQNHVFFAPVGVTISAHSNGFLLGGVLQITTPIAFDPGQNTIRFAFSSAVPQGIADEAWDLRGLTVTGPAATPEPAAWALMLLGFLGAGAGLRHARRQGARLPA